MKSALLSDNSALWECINSGLDYWNGGIVEWWTGGSLFLFSLFVMLHLLCSFGRTLLHLLSSWIPRFGGLLIVIDTQVQRKYY